MKTVSKISFLIVFSLFFITSPIFAAAPVSTPSKAIVIASVDIQNAKIVSQSNNNFNISFSLSNGKGLQAGVKYGVKLVSTSNKIQTTVDEKIYDESLTMYEDSSVDKTIQYTAPSILDGVYSIFLTSSNEANFSFSTAYLGQIRLKSSAKGLTIDPASCVYYVNNSKDDSLYKIDQVVDIDNTESLGIKCVAVNNLAKEVQVTPSFVTNEKSAYGKVVKTDAGDTKTETFKAGEKKVISFILPKASTSGLYFLTMGLKQTEDISNTINLTYLIRGNIASISNLFLDKDYYAKGETANISFMWNSMAGKLLRGSLDSSSILLTANIKDYNNKDCSSVVNETLVKDFSKPKTDLPISITKNCFNPTFTLTLKDDKNTILDEKSFSMQTVSVKKPINMTPFIIGILVLILILIIFLVYKKNKNIINSGAENNTKINILIVFMFIFGGLLFAHNAHANSYFDTMNVGGSSCYIAYSASIDKPSGYMINDTLTASATIGACGCSDGRAVFCGVQSTASQGGSSLSPTSPQLLSMLGTSGSASYQLPSWGGSGSVNFTSSINGSFGGTSVGFSVSTPVIPSLSVWADNNTITSGSQAHIHWESSNATSCISTDGGTYDTRLSGDYYNTPTADKTYAVTCFGASGSLTESTKVLVTAANPSVKAWKNSSDSIPYNTSDVVNWISTNATSCSCFYYNTQNSGYCPGFTSTGPKSGFFPTPPLKSNTTYNFSCSN